MTDHRLVRCTDLESRVSTLTPGNDTDIVMHTVDLLDAWFIRDRRDLLIGVTSSIPCLSRVKGRKGGSNLMGANALVCSASPYRSRTAVASCDHGASSARCLTGFKLC